MADRRIGNEALPVGLGEADPASIEDGDDRETGQNLGVEAGFGKQRQRETQEAVSTHLEHDCGKHDRTGSRCLGMGLGQPGVEGEHWDLDRKAKEEGPKDKALSGWRKPGVEEGREIEGIDAGLGGMLDVEREEADEESNTACHGVV